jgi:hypothetical protein
MTFASLSIVFAPNFLEAPELSTAPNQAAARFSIASHAASMAKSNQTIQLIFENYVQLFCDSPQIPEALPVASPQLAPMMKRATLKLAHNLLLELEQEDAAMQQRFKQATTDANRRRSTIDNHSTSATATTTTVGPACTPSRARAKQQQKQQQQPEQQLQQQQPELLQQPEQRGTSNSSIESLQLSPRYSVPSAAWTNSSTRVCTSTANQSPPTNSNSRTHTNSTVHVSRDRSRSFPCMNHHCLPYRLMQHHRHRHHRLALPIRQPQQL